MVLGYRVEPVYYEHLGTSHKYSDNQGALVVQFILLDKLSFGTSTKCVDDAGVLVFKCLH